jgi:hypothetical protein
MRVAAPRARGGKAGDSGEHAVETQTLGLKVRRVEVCLGDWVDWVEEPEVA